MSKYHSRKVTVDGITFDSIRELRRWNELLILQKAGKITDLQRQVKFVLIPSQYINGKCVERECSYIADFVYWDKSLENRVVEDSKGFRTAEYIIKRKLMLKEYGIKIAEI